MKPSITDNWQKETKLVGSETLTLFKKNGQVMGITASYDGDVCNEAWSYDASVELEEAMEMKFFEPDDCPTEEQLQRWFNEGNSGFYEGD